MKPEIVAYFSETLLEASVDNFHFRAAWHPMEQDSCILWFRDSHVTGEFEALGKFSRFDKRHVLEFITRFSTSHELRLEIDLRRFERRIERLTPRALENMRHLTERQKRHAFRNLYNLDAQIEQGELERKRKIMARKFHPDRGGNHIAMSVINEAYDYLKANA